MMIYALTSTFLDFVYVAKVALTRKTHGVFLLDNLKKLVYAFQGLMLILQNIKMQ